MPGSKRASASWTRTSPAGYWPGGTALGQRLFQGSQEGPDAEAYTVVGVVGAVKQAGLSEGDAVGAVYYPYAQQFDNALYVVTQTRVDPDAFGGTLQRLVRSIDPELPVNNIRIDGDTDRTTA